MKKLVLILFSVSILFSCTEMLPDLSPNTPAGKEMVVVDYNLNIKNIVENDNVMQGAFKRSRGFDINEDGLDDFWFTKINYKSGVFSDNSQYHLGINGDFLAEAESKILSNVSFYNAHPAKIILPNQIIGNNNINNSLWMSEGYRYGLLDYDQSIYFLINNLTPQEFINASSLANNFFKASIFHIRVSQGYFGEVSTTLSRDYVYYVAIKLNFDGKPHLGWIKFDGEELISAAYSTVAYKNVITNK